MVITPIDEDCDEEEVIPNDERDSDGGEVHVAMNGDVWNFKLVMLGYGHKWLSNEEEDLMSMKFDFVDDVDAIYDMDSRYVVFNVRRDEKKGDKDDITIKSAIDWFCHATSAVFAKADNTFVMPSTEIKALEMHASKVYTRNVLLIIWKHLRRVSSATGTATGAAAGVTTGEGNWTGGDDWVEGAASS
ncbi:hypothetical protein M9H77_06658 [Catharanthus roseus]|uniref:Uncharacterized protein n=1 Tax=Catharanthus roseus TaxID=4058 RepID=A0ACC0BSY5_CATRO|nr:hypothetical protein M9H77_06658 [Catharanthus roseus]